MDDLPTLNALIEHLKRLPSVGQKSAERMAQAFLTFDDETLKRWMDNAKKQAAENIKDMIIEFRDSSIIGFSTFFKGAVIIIVQVILFSFIATLFFRACS